MPDVKRATRVSNEVRGELMRLLQREVRDTRLRAITVTDVKLTDDLRNAKVYFRVFNDDSKEARKGAETGLAAAAGFLRREIGQALQMKFAPELRFYFDDRLDEALRVDQLLHEVSEDDKRRKR